MEAGRGADLSIEKQARAKAAGATDLAEYLEERGAISH